MADSTYSQSNFQGGEFSTAFSERIEEPGYKAGLALCLNYVPTQEGTLRSRSGFKRGGNTKFNEVPKLHSFGFSTQEPYVAECTPNNIRLWSQGFPIIDGAVNVSPGGGLGVISSVTGDPPTFTFQVLPEAWAEGDSVLLRPGYDGVLDTPTMYAAVMEAIPALLNREFVLSDLDVVMKTCTLTDAVTGDPLTGTITISSGHLLFVRILDIPTAYPTVDNIRLVEHADQVVTTDPNTNQIRVTAPDQRATFLHPVVSPQSFSYAQSLQPSPDDNAYQTNQNLALVAEQFVDGPYLDSSGTGYPLVVSGTTGTITVTMHQWASTIRYMKGDLVLDYTQNLANDPYFYMSLTDNNVGHAVPASAAGGAINANWLQINCQLTTWDSATTYGVGHAVTNVFYDGGGTVVPVTELPVYYSKVASNTNHEPKTSGTQWGTTPPTYSGAVTYVKAAIVVKSGITYASLANANVGNDPSTDAGVHWAPLPISHETAVSTLTDILTGWLAGPIFHVDDAGGSTSTLGITYDTDNPGRVFRMKWAPQPWNNKTTYAANDEVNYNDNIFKALTSANLGNTPDTDATNWEIKTDTICWTWGRIVGSSVHQFVAQIEIIGPDLPSNIPIWEFRLGVFSDTTGWPTCGGYHEGRVWLAGAMPNRIDAGQPNQGFAFSPTAKDGTVADNNAISYVLNSKRREAILSLSSISEGVQVNTDYAEWLFAASAINDPLTPTSIQAHPTTKWGAYPNDTTEIPTGLTMIQRGGRRVMEGRNFVDQSSYQSRLNALDLTERCQHLTIGGVGETAYQSLSQPIIWVCPQDLTTVAWAPVRVGICPLYINAPTIQTQIPETADLFGISYMRSPTVQYEAPFSYEHGLTYAGNPLRVKNIAVSPYYLPGQENLYIAVQDPDGLCYIEMLMPFTESKVIGPDNPLQIKTAVDGDGVVTTYGIHDSDFMLDSGVTPFGVQLSVDGTTAKFFGLWPHASFTVVFTCMGQEIGEYLIGADGTVTIPFDATFTLALLGQSLNRWPAYLPGGPHVDASGGTEDGKNNLLPKAYFAPFVIDPNGNEFTYWGGTTDVCKITEGIFCQFGWRYRRRGKMLRPIVGGQNGPVFAKITQADRAGISVDAAQEISAGTSFDALVDLALTKNSPEIDNSPLGSSDFVTQRVRDFIKDDYSFNGQIVWEQTKAVAGGVLAVGGFHAVEDI